MAGGWAPQEPAQAGDAGAELNNSDVEEQMLEKIKENLHRITDSRYVVDQFLAVYGENRMLERRYEQAKKEITRLKAERDMMRKLFELQNHELRKLEEKEMQTK